MEIRHLRYFVCLAEELHFGRAARRLAISQPPLSVAIQQLEEYVGARLLTRSSRSVALTAAGEALLPKARVLLNELTLAMEHAQAVGHGRLGRLRMGMVGTMVFCGLPEVVADFESAHPGVQLSLSEMSSAAQIAAVRAGELDLGLVHAMREPEGLRTQRVYSQSLWVCLRSQSPWANLEQVDLDQLGQEKLMLVSREVSPDYHDAVLDVCASLRWRPRSVHGLQHWLSVVALVAQGSGVGLAPEALARAGLPGVVMRPVLQALPRYDTYAVWREGQDHAALEAFVRALPSVSQSVV